MNRPFSYLSIALLLGVSAIAQASAIARHANHEDDPCGHDGCKGGCPGTCGKRN